MAISGMVSYTETNALDLKTVGQWLFYFIFFTVVPFLPNSGAWKKASPFYKNRTLTKKYGVSLWL